MSELPCFLKVADVLSADCYSVPIYQRNYAWGVHEIEQLLDDVSDHALQSGHKNYYIGTLVVYAEGGAAQPSWQVVDGQQRLSTLALLCAVLRQDPAVRHLFAPVNSMNLQFDSRPEAGRALRAIFANPRARPGDQADGGARTIWAGRDVMAGKLRPMLQEKALPIEKFAEFLLNHVVLLRVELPRHTDLNHYFEVMNSRGEQLAKHEVLKARLLSYLHEANDALGMRALHTVWDACSVMDRYVQLGFAAELRKRLFEEQGWRLNVDNAQALCNCFQEAKEVHGVAPRKISELVAQATTAPEKEATAAEEEGLEEGEAHFGPVINWPNFLLQVLALVRHVEWCGQQGRSEDEAARAEAHVVLDDKNLLEQFQHLRQPEAIRRFTFYLLQCRFWLDQYVVKRTLHAGPQEEERWALKRCRFRHGKASMYAINTFGRELAEGGDDPLQHRIAMLQAAFHVSYPLARRKHWLQGVLRWLQRHASAPVDAQEFLLAQEALAKSFALEVRTGLWGDVRYEDVINRMHGFFTPAGAGLDVQSLADAMQYPKVHPFVLNFLDYLLWLRGGEAAQNFIFTTARRSIEHLHPQNQYVENSEYQWPEGQLHALGNLCLVSQSMNSKLSDRAEKAKFDELRKEASFPSLKVHAMHEAFLEDGGRWRWMNASDGNNTVKAMGLERHHQAMLQLLRDSVAAHSNRLLSVSPDTTIRPAGPERAGVCSL